MLSSPTDESRNNSLEGVKALWVGFSMGQEVAPNRFFKLAYLSDSDMNGEGDASSHEGSKPLQLGFRVRQTSCLSQIDCISGLVPMIHA